MRQEPHLAGHDAGAELLLVGHVGVDIALHHLVTTAVGVEVPGPGAGSPVLQLVFLSKLLTLSTSIPAHGLRSSDQILCLQIDLQPLPHTLGDTVGWTPGTSLHVLSHPATMCYKIVEDSAQQTKKLQRNFDLVIMLHLVASEKTNIEAKLATQY